MGPSGGGAAHILVEARSQSCDTTLKNWLAHHCLLHETGRDFVAATYALNSTRKLGWILVSADGDMNLLVLKVVVSTANSDQLGLLLRSDAVPFSTPWEDVQHTNLSLNCGKEPGHPNEP